MNAVVSLSDEEDLIRVTESGTVTAADFESSIRRILELHETTGCRWVLVDARQQSSPTEGFEAFNRGKLASKILAGRPIRLAVIVNEALAEGHDFLETVSRNRGLLMQMFTEESAARAWLRH